MTERQLLERLADACDVTTPEQAPEQFGVYVVFAKLDDRLFCLRVGTAGDRGTRSLRQRIKEHYRSSPGDTVFAQHMEADHVLSATCGYDLSQQVNRQRFLREVCFVRAVPMPEAVSRELHDAEVILEYHFRPRYRDGVGGDYGPIEQTRSPEQVLADLPDHIR